MPCFSTWFGPLRNREPAQTFGGSGPYTVVTVVVIVIVVVIVVLPLLSPVTTTLSSSPPHPCREREAITPKTTAANARRNCMIKDRSRRIVRNDRSKSRKSKISLLEPYATEDHTCQPTACNRIWLYRAIRETKIGFCWILRNAGTSPTAWICRYRSTSGFQELEPSPGSTCCSAWPTPQVSWSHLNYIMLPDPKSGFQMIQRKIMRNQPMVKETIVGQWSKPIQGSGTEKHQEKILETKANTSQKLMSEVPFQSSATDATVCN